MSSSTVRGGMSTIEPLAPGPGSLGCEPSLGTPMWLDCACGQVFTWLHSPPVESTGGIAVLICPPFGWEEEKSYRGRRIWADGLAGAGFATARIDLPGTGDSAGTPREPGRVDAWTMSVHTAASWLKRRTGASRVVALGLGLGGLLGWRAAAQAAPIDDFILWAVPDSGRRLLREVQIQAGIISGQEAAAPFGEEEDSAAVGYLLRSDTVRDLKGLRLSELALPDPGGRRALVLTRDGLGADSRVSTLLQEAGAEVSVADVPGWDTLMVDPEVSRPPIEAIERSLEWLQRAEPTPRRTISQLHVGDERGSGQVREADVVELMVGESLIRETTVRPQWGDDRLFGILSEPAAPSAEHELFAVLLNTAGIRASGPARTWNEIGRRWAARGIPTLRVDLAGSGDSDGDPRRILPDSMYLPDRIDEALFLVRQMEERLSGRAVVVGLCASAYLALNAAFQSSTLAGIMLLNPNLLYWSAGLADDAVTGRAIESLRGRSWRKLMSGDITVAQARRQLGKLGPARVTGMVRANRQRQHGAEQVLEQLRSLDAETLLMFGDHEVLRDRMESDGELQRVGSWPHVTVDYLSGSPGLVEAGFHTFRTIDLQREMHATVDRALERTLARLTPRAAPVAPQAISDS